MQDSTLFMIVAVSLIAGVSVIAMLLATIRSVVRSAQLTALKSKCVARGMCAADIERVVMVGLDNCSSKRRVSHVEDDLAPLEKAPPPVVGDNYAFCR
jgi:hypothetical protein